MFRQYVLTRVDGTLKVLEVLPQDQRQEEGNDKK